MSKGKTVLGVIVGVAFGATLGILFAPNKGSETRRKIIRKGDDYLDNIENKIEDFMDKITDKYDDVKKDATRLSERAIAKKNELISELTNNDHKK
jgi:gas vesicle protein